MWQAGQGRDCLGTLSRGQVWRGRQGMDRLGWVWLGVAGEARFCLVGPGKVRLAINRKGNQ